jgi:hypothetical protein
VFLNTQKKGATVDCGAFAKRNPETGPGYFPFLGAFLSAFLAFFAMQNLLPSFNRLLLAAGMRTHGSPAR